VNVGWNKKAESDISANRDPPQEFRVKQDTDGEPRFGFSG
jgi:hypothetical protein